ncbi:hypothetical protein P170DRAFT_470047 [Aspergillus steynii IBT 23096]|uniref:Uncharacterized protein n=1 Tax=Aspergillus steynii IBT 23096 TaxID=1392250 RepID=A0A2I2GNY5_9EURO|nr:uncharacterized protein P170DRAFT_470047 [Aspergillus steynii IBT 23096]PLB54586.1 hypothetical protein P170DRAFT_470047 [Aspergillus steynii IBT 23096]
MRLRPLFSSQLRIPFSRTVQREVGSRLSIWRLATPSRNSSSSAATSHARNTMRRVPPERILVYHAGTKRINFIGAMRITTILLFGTTCVLIAPAMDAKGEERWKTGTIIAGSAIPMLFVAFVAAPYVNFIHLSLPVFARQSREHALQYALNPPPTATLWINTMKFSAGPRLTKVRLADLGPHKSGFPPVNFSLRFQRQPATTINSIFDQTKFFAEPQCPPGPPARAFYPQAWETMFKNIQSQRPGYRKNVKSEI